MAGEYEQFTGLIGNQMRGRGHMDALSSMDQDLDDKRDFIEDNWSDRSGQVDDAYAPLMTQGLNNMEDWGNYTFDAPQSYQGEDFNFNFEQDPGYNFRQAEGQKSLAAQAAKNGALGDSAYMKGLMGYNQDFASNEYDKAYKRDRSAYEYDENSNRNQHNVEGNWAIDADRRNYDVLNNSVNLASNATNSSQNLQQQGWQNYTTDMNQWHDDHANMTYEKVVAPWDRMATGWEDGGKIAQTASDNYNSMGGGGSGGGGMGSFSGGGSGQSVGGSGTSSSSGYGGNMFDSGGSMSNDAGGGADWSSFSSMFS